MIRRILHIVCSLWLALLLLFGGTPMDAIHSFAHHKDTVHTRTDGSGYSISEAHHHCSFLAFQLMPFATPPQLPFYSRMPAKVFAVYSEAVARRCAHYFIPRVGLRGPPAVC